VEGPRKTSALVIALLKALSQDYPAARKIHVILDNFRIHDSRITRQALSSYEGRIVFHFLPRTARTRIGSSACGWTSTPRRPATTPTRRWTP